MRLLRTSVHRAVVVAAAAGLVGAGLVAMPAAASPASPDTAARVASQLGDRSAGAYRDADGTMVVTVTDSAAAATARSAGAVPRLVRHGATELATVRTALDRSVGVTGTAWAVDPVTDRVVATADGTVTGDRLAALTAAVARYGDAASLVRVPGTFSLKISGGDAIWGGQYRCSLGFNVHKGSGAYFLTAGHCGNVASTWYSDQAHTHVLGSNSGSVFPGHDYAMVHYTSSVSHPSAVDLYSGSQTISRAANASVGESVRRSGSTSHVHSGRVTALNATVHYAEGTVTGMIQTNVCAEPGDSGGALFDGASALGLTSGGSGNCSSGGTTFFQPVTGALSHFGATIP